MQGLLLLNKPEGITSYGAVSAVKRLSGEKRVGHTGTLDPMATGVLPIFIGRPTVLSSYLLKSDKSYEACVKLGVVTDTGDITGNVIRRQEVDITPQSLEKVLESFQGKIRQTPPIYSAIKQNGVPLYQLARQGKMAEIPEREVEIFSLDVISPLKDGEFRFFAKVSKGTYIRSLAMDIGDRLGCGATLTSLCRTQTAGFSLERCVRLQDLNENNISNHLLNEELAVSYMREINVTQRQAVRFCNGGQLSYDRLNIADIADGETFRVKFADRFLGIGVAHNESKLLYIKCIVNDWEAV